MGCEMASTDLDLGLHLSYDIGVFPLPGCRILCLYVIDRGTR
jgi:hypothetical protein